MPVTSKVRITFIVDIENSPHQPQPGQKIFVCGSAKELGEWDTKQAISLELVAGSETKWSKTQEFSRNTGFEYKYFCPNENSAEGVAWEDRPNREILVGVKETSFEDVWAEGDIDEEAERKEKTRGEILQAELDELEEERKRKIAERKLKRAAAKTSAPVEKSEEERKNEEAKLKAENEKKKKS